MDNILCAYRWCRHPLNKHILPSKPGALFGCTKCGSLPGGDEYHEFKSEVEEVTG